MQLEQNHGWHGRLCCAVQKQRVHLFACTHPSVSNTLDCTDWLVCKHQSTALCSNTFVLWFLVVYRHQSPPCVSNTFGLWILVCVHTSVSSLVFQTRLDYGYLSVYTHQTPALCSNTFGLWFFVCVHAPVNSPLFQTRLIVVACLFTLPPTP